MSTLRITKIVALLTLLVAVCLDLGLAEEASVLEGAEVYINLISTYSGPPEELIGKSFLSYLHSKKEIGDKFCRISTTESHNIKTVFVNQLPGTGSVRMGTSYICVSIDSTYPPPE